MSLGDLLARRGGRDTTSAVRSRPPRWCVATALLLPATLVTGWLAADAAQPPGYSPFRQTLSVTAGYAGAHREIMTSSLAVIGLCYLVLGAALVEVGAPARLGLMVSGLSGLAIAADPVPRHGMALMHDVAAAVGAVSIMIWPLVVSRGREAVHTWVQRPDVAITVTLLFVALSGWLVAETRSGTALGLAERISTTVQSTWPAVVVIGLRCAGVRRLDQSVQEPTSPASS